MNQKCFNPADMSHDNMDKTNTLINENIKKLPTQEKYYLSTQKNQKMVSLAKTRKQTTKTSTG